MDVDSFDEIRDEFLARVHSVVWCNVATLDRRGRPRSRILHPIWEGSTGWIVTRAGSFKAKHLAAHPYISLAYIADIAKPVYADCYAEWVTSTEDKQRIWTLFQQAPPPLGYDPGSIFPTVDHPESGVLKLTPWRIEVANFPGQKYVWRNPEAS